MKAIIFACLLIAVASAFTIDCPSTNYKCAGNNGACSYTITDTSQTIVDCSGTQFCNYTSTNSDGTYSGTCASYYSSGHDCRIAGDDCDNGLYCKAGSSGIWGTCTTITYNVGAGGACDGNAGTLVCSVSTYCNSTGNGICLARATSGQSCTSTPCSIDTVCGSASTCVKQFSVAVGSSCVTSNFYNTECVAGAACVSGTCTSIASSSNKACGNATDTTTCTASYEVCRAGCYGSSANATYQCINQYSSRVYTSSEANDLNNLYSCQLSNNNLCESVGTCGSCKSQACAVNGGDGPCGGYCGSASGVAVSAILLIAALFIAM